MTGLITTRNNTYLFRDDHHYDPCIWAWNIKDEKSGRGRSVLNKWHKMPKGYIELFDLDNPPRTVRYIPM